MRLEAAIRGDLKKFMAAQVDAAKTAVTEAVQEAGTRIKLALREQVSAAGLGKGVANAWRLEMFPKGKKSLGAAAYVKTNVPNIIYAFNYGVNIKSERGVFLAIPTASAPKRGSDGKRISPSNFPEASLGKLRFIYRSGKPSLLVVDDVRARTGKKEGFIKASPTVLRTGRGLASAVMFILVPQVHLKKRLNIESVAERVGGQVPQLVLDHMPNVEEKL